MTNDKLKIFENTIRRIVRKYLREADEQEEEDPNAPPDEESAPPEQEKPAPEKKPTQDTPPAQPAQKPRPKKPENSGLKYEMKYVNGGFNNGVKIAPTNGGKIALSISIYGGGEPKNVNLPASPAMSKIIKGYEVAVKNNDQLGLTMEPKLDQYITGMQEEISVQVIHAMQEFDEKVKHIIINAIKGTK